MIHVALRLERRRRCLAMLVPRVVRDVEKTRRRAEPNDPLVVLGFAHVCSLVLWVHIRKSLRKHGSCFLTVAPDRQNKPRVLLNRYGLFFSPSQNGSRAVGSLAVQQRSVRAEGRGEASGSALFPPLHRGGLASLLLWLDIQPRSGEWRTAMWAKKAKGLP